MNAHPLPRAGRPLATPPQWRPKWRRGLMTLVVGCSAVLLATLTAAPSPVYAAATTAGPARTGSHSAKPHRKAATAKSRVKPEPAEAPKPQTTEAAKRKPRRPTVGRAANPAPVLPEGATLGDAKSAAQSSAFEQGPGVLGISLRTLRQQQIKEYVTVPVAMVALAFDDLRFAPVNKGTHVEANLGDRIAFEGKGDKLSPRARRPLDVIARILTDNPQTRIEVLVHTDDSGDPGYDLSQSQRSADVVKTYLVAKGVAAERITAVGRGAEAPLIATGKRTPTRRERNRNRRVELVVAPWVPIAATPTERPVGEMTPQESQPPGLNQPMLVR